MLSELGDDEPLRRTERALPGAPVVTQSIGARVLWLYDPRSGEATARARACTHKWQRPDVRFGAQVLAPFRIDLVPFEFLGGPF